MKVRALIISTLLTILLVITVHLTRAIAQPAECISDIHDRLERFTAPTLIHHGKSGSISVEASKAIHNRIPKSQVSADCTKQGGAFRLYQSPTGIQSSGKGVCLVKLVLN